MDQDNHKHNWEKQGNELEMELNFLIYNTRGMTADREEIKRNMITQNTIYFYKSYRDTEGHQRQYLVHVTSASLCILFWKII